MPGVGDLMMKLKKSPPPDGPTKPALLNNFVKDNDPEDKPSSPQMGLLSRIKQLQHTNDNETNGNDGCNLESSAGLNRNVSLDSDKPLLQNLKVGLSKSSGKDSIFSRLKSAKANHLKDSSNESNGLTTSQSSKQMVSKKSKRTSSLFSRGSMTPKSLGESGRSFDYSDDEFLNSDSDEEAGSPEPPPQPFWSMFEESILKINDQTETMSLQPRPNFKSSEDFKGVMVDMYGNTEYGRTKGYTLLKNKINRLGNVSGLASRLFSNAIKTPDVEDEEKEEDEMSKEIDEERERENLKSELKGAKRGWKLLRRNVNETALKENTKDSKMKWSMIRHHLIGMSDLDRARQDLYERYGLVPTQQEDGTIQCKNVMWSQRAIALNMTHPSYYKLPSKPGKERKKNRTQSARPASSAVRPSTSASRGPSRRLPARPSSESKILK